MLCPRPNTHVLPPSILYHCQFHLKQTIITSTSLSISSQLCHDVLHLCCRVASLWHRSRSARRPLSTVRSPILSLRGSRGLLRPRSPAQATQERLDVDLRVACWMGARMHATNGHVLSSALRSSLNC